MEGKPYLNDTNTLMKAGLWSPQKFKRVLLQNRSYLMEQRQKEIAVGAHVRFHVGSAAHDSDGPVHIRIPRPLPAEHRSRALAPSGNSSDGASQSSRNRGDRRPVLLQPYRRHGAEGDGRSSAVHSLHGVPPVQLFERSGTSAAPRRHVLKRGVSSRNSRGLTVFPGGQVGAGPGCCHPACAIGGKQAGRRG